MMAGVEEGSCRAGPLTCGVWHYPQIGDRQCPHWVKLQDPQLLSEKCWVVPRKQRVHFGTGRRILITYWYNSIFSAGYNWRLYVWYSFQSQEVLKKDMRGEGFNLTRKGSSFSFVSIAIHSIIIWAIMIDDWIFTSPVRISQVPASKLSTLG